MNLIKKSDVKNHLSSRNHHGIHLHRPVGQPTATGLSGDQSGRADSSSGNVVETTPNIPSSSGPTQVQPDSSHLVTIAESKGAQV
jgi:hypothetical protein